MKTDLLKDSNSIRRGAKTEADHTKDARTNPETNLGAKIA
jgi:hypothetical protein